jgi:uncharacterized membrane protein
MPRWLWILIGVLAAIALIIFIVANANLDVKGSGVPGFSNYGYSNYQVVGV